MLFDPKWNQQTKADPLSLESLIAWLEQQPADKTYCFLDTGRCLIATYFQAKNIAKSVGGVTFLPLGSKVRRKIPDCFNEVAEFTPFTYGAALERARALRGES